MEADVMARVGANAARIYRDAVEQKDLGKVLCKCEECGKREPDKPVWERAKFVKRSTAAEHMRKQRLRLRLPPASKGRQSDQSFWTPETIVAAMRREVLAAFGAETDAADMSFYEANASDTGPPADDFEGDFSAVPEQPSEWAAPPEPIMLDGVGLMGYFADPAQSAKLSKAELLKLMPGHDGSLLVKASPVTIEEALQGTNMSMLCFCM